MLALVWLCRWLNDSMTHLVWWWDWVITDRTNQLNSIFNRFSIFQISWLHQNFHSHKRVTTYDGVRQPFSTSWPPPKSQPMTGNYFSLFPRQCGIALTQASATVGPQILCYGPPPPQRKLTFPPQKNKKVFRLEAEAKRSFEKPISKLKKKMFAFVWGPKVREARRATREEKVFAQCSPFAVLNRATCPNTHV